MPKRETLKAEDVAEALKATGGLVYLAAERLGVSSSTVYRYGQRHATVKEAIRHQKGKRGDTAEASLWKAVLKGEAWAVCFYLKTQCKDRGYVERTEQRTVKDDELDAVLARELARLAQGGPGPAAGDGPGA